MHPRRAILEAMRVLLGSSSPAIPVFEQDETSVTPSFQIAAGRETRGEDSTKGAREILLEVEVTARGSSPTERDQLSEELELLLLGPTPAWGLEIEFDSVEMELPRDGAGQRTYPATYALVVRYFSDRS